MRDLVVRVTQVFEQQPERQIRQRVADLVQQHEQQHEQRAAALKELAPAARSMDCTTRAAIPDASCGSRCRGGSPRTNPTSIAGKANTAHARYAACQPQRAAITSASAPADTEPIRQPYCDMPEPTPSCRGSQRFDAIGIDHDVVGRASERDEDRRHAP